MTITAAGLAATNDANSTIVWLCLLTIKHANGVTRFVNNNESIVSNGDTYDPFPFSFQLPQDDGQSLPEVTLVIQNFDDVLVEAIRQTSVAPTIEVQVVTSATPDVPEIKLENLVLRSVSYDAITISGKLTVVNVLTRAFGAKYTPVEFPALFT